jgi:hypothetical protein
VFEALLFLLFLISHRVVGVLFGNRGIIYDRVRIELNACLKVVQKRPQKFMLKTIILS